MTKSIPALTIAATLGAFVLSATQGNAAATRTWVSGKGTDSGTCTLASPCRTFTFALTQTAAGGEIDVLDPAGYGSVTITQSISIVNDGVGEAGVQAGAGANAITINAGATDVIYLRGLIVDGAHVAQSGIMLNTGGSVTIANCTVRNFSQNGIFIGPPGTTIFSITKTSVSDNGFYGIIVRPQGTGTAKGVIDEVVANNNHITGIIDGTGTTGSMIQTTIVDSIASNNLVHGMIAYSTANHSTSNVSIRNSTASSNGTSGFEVYGNANLWHGHSTASGNSNGLMNFNATAYSYGDNNLLANTVEVNGTVTPVSTR
jgi:hypothetical protein